MSKVAEERKPVIKAVDMTPEVKESTMKIANKALDLSDQEKDIAGYIKKEMDKHHPGTWHCIVGRNFGSFVTHEEGCFIYFYLSKVAILVFRSA